MRASLMQREGHRPADAEYCIREHGDFIDKGLLVGCRPGAVMGRVRRCPG